MERRRFLQTAGAVTGLALLGGLSLRTSSASAQTSLFGPLLEPDANGLRLPAGFQSRVIATTNQVVGSTGYVWHPNPDGGATFALPDGGWIYVSNNEGQRGTGGVSMVRFDQEANIVEARSICEGTTRNCAGGPTPWGTWLSCEEFNRGQVWECDPFGVTPAQVRPAMGVFSHEAAAANPVDEVIYLTEDKPDSLLYRFTPDVWGDLSAGLLECMTEVDGVLDWVPVPDPSAVDTPTREQVPAGKRFDGAEGAWFADGLLYFTTKGGDDKVWCYDVAANELEIIYDRGTSPTPILNGVDNVTLSAAGDIYVCEDGGNMEVVILSPDGSIGPFLRMDISDSEVTGVAFDPSGTRMIVSSQRNPGATYEISGPFLTATCKGEPVTIDMNSGQSGVGTDGNDVILGTAGDDVISAGGGDDVICAGDGDDTVAGGDGNDRIDTGAGADQVERGAGKDKVVRTIAG